MGCPTAKPLPPTTVTTWSETKHLAWAQVKSFKLLHKSTQGYYIKQGGLAHILHEISQGKIFIYSCTSITIDNRKHFMTLAFFSTSGLLLHKIVT